LAWLIAQPQTNAIAGARYPEQAKDNAQAANIKANIANLNKTSTLVNLALILAS
jgi:myo-inositol catabolism protein IolS